MTQPFPATYFGAPRWRRDGKSHAPLAGLFGRALGGKEEELIFDTDMRFMQGTFVGTDGK